MPYDPMQEFQRVMRMQTLYGGAPPNIDASSVTGPTAPPYDAGARMSQLYQPRTDISQQYSQQLQRVPERQPVGKLRQIAAAIAGLGAGVHPSAYEGGAALGFSGNPQEAMNVTDAVANKPYYDKLRDFNVKTEALGKGAAEEDKYNTNQRMLANETVLREENESKQRLNETKQAAADKIAQEKIKISQQRADVYAFKASHPDWKFVTEKGGNVFAVNPQNPDMKLDTGIDSGTLSDLDKINLGVSGRLSEIAATGNEARKTADIKGDITGTNIVKRGEQQRQTNKEKPAITAATKDRTETITTPQGTATKVVKYGPQPIMVKMKALNGKFYNVPADKVEDAKKHHMVEANAK